MGGRRKSVHQESARHLMDYKKVFSDYSCVTKRFSASSAYFVPGRP